MATLEKRVDELERRFAPKGNKRDWVIHFIRAPDMFCSGYLRLSTGEQISQEVNESDADFVIRAKAAGFERNNHVDA